MQNKMLQKISNQWKLYFFLSLLDIPTISVLKSFVSELNLSRKKVITCVRRNFTQLNEDIPHSNWGAGVNYGRIRPWIPIFREVLYLDIELKHLFKCILLSICLPECTLHEQLYENLKYWHSLFCTVSPSGWEKEKKKSDKIRLKEILRV